ncbi:hypothetical protein KP509_04G050400 [Ceratopteris richardii]|uniref:Uncharacterized protein n=1 Tax=Ceratopteris richardii TaxID=49495 RepID=A0A8T2UVB1_CERRI|nr:hypothetical protein KP509_04G050400 [Ceratopteris richardii]
MYKAFYVAMCVSDYCVGDYFRDSREATDKVLAKRGVPILVGGTGMYLRWYLYGRPDAPKSTPELRAWVQEEIAKAGGDWDKAVSMVVDAGDKDARKLLRNDWYRLVRRFEVLKASGTPRGSKSLLYSELEDESEDHPPQKRIYRAIDDLDYEFVCFFLYSSRKRLYDHIDQRCEEMLTGNFGLLKEASWLLDKGILANTSPASRAIGYRQAMEYLARCREADGVSSPEQFIRFVEDFQKASRNFAKRQLTWFRQEPLYHWIDVSKQQEAVIDFIIKAYYDPNIIVSEASKGILIDKKSTVDKKNKLRDYMPQRKVFVTAEDCSEILDWISKTQRRKADGSLHGKTQDEREG